MSIIKQVEADISSSIKELGYNKNIVLEKTSRPDLGEYQINDAMTLAKEYHKNPKIIAEEIVKKLENDYRFENINIAGPGFINLSFSEKFLIESLNSIATDINNNIDKKENKKVVIDYGGANVAKALHVGHLRSANIGEALKRLARKLGYEVISDAHLGDYGRPLGLVLLEIEKRYPDLEFFNKDYEGNYEELDIPITNEDLEEIYPFASNKAKEDEKYLEEARIMTNRLQDHEKGIYDLWKKVVEISKIEIRKIYEYLNVSFDLWEGESDSAEYIDETLKIFEDKNLTKMSDGAKIVEVIEEGETSPMPPVLLVKSNNTYSYETTDIATILERVKKFNPDEIWYVTDGRQELHFEQVFRAVKKSNIVKQNIKLEFIGFGTMNGEDGKPFKTRDGGVMTLNNLIELVKESTRKRINHDIVEKDKVEDTINDISVAALKYADLIPYRKTDYIFNPEKFSETEGKTGPYLLYSTIRMKSLLEKGKDLIQKKYLKINNNTDKEIVLTLLELPRILNKAIDTKSLNDITDYLYLLTNKYNKFYSENKILIQENLELRESWLVLTKQVYKVNLLLLDILGIKVPEKI